VPCEVLSCFRELLITKNPKSQISKSQILSPKSQILNPKFFVPVKRGRALFRHVPYKWSDYREDFPTQLVAQSLCFLVLHHDRIHLIFES